MLGIRTRRPPPFGGVQASDDKDIQVQIPEQESQANLWGEARLLLPGVPISIIGLLALPWQARGPALRPVLLVGAITFLVTSLAFPVATTWGTFLHAAGPAHVLLVISALLALDATIARIGVYRGWTRPVAWLGATLGIAGSLLFSAVLLPSFGSGSRDTAQLYDELGRRMAAIGQPLHQAGVPVISNFPIWLADTQGVYGLALPNEPPSAVIDLARTFKARTLVLVGDAHGQWPAILDQDVPDADCFRSLDLGPGPAGGADRLAHVHVYEIVCP